MLVKRNGTVVGELVAHTDTFGNPAWDAHAVSPKTGERKLLETFVKQKHQDGMQVLKDAEKAIKAHKWEPNIFNNRKSATLRLSHNTTFNCPEVFYTYGKSSLKLIMRDDDPNGANANVIDAVPTVQKDIAFIVEYFTSHYTQVSRITNQVSNEKELRAMWNACFFHGDLRKLDDHLKALKERGSIMMTWNRPEPRCKKCNCKPEELVEYRIAASEEGCTPLQFMQANEGTYNPKTGKFCCVTCYIKAGMPEGIA